MDESMDEYEVAPGSCADNPGLAAAELHVKTKAKAEAKAPAVPVILTWLTVFVVVVFTLVIAWRLLALPEDSLQIQFAFTDFLALILALFAVGLSAAFYFRSTSESSKFFENVYGFTKDVSVVLGKIEAGFGERLKHLDEGYASIRDSVDALPSAIKAREKELDTAEDAMVKLQKERDDIARSMLTARHADKSRIEALTSELEAKDSEIAGLRHEVVERSRNLRRSLHQPDELGRLEARQRHLEAYLSSQLIPSMGVANLRKMKHQEVVDAFTSCESELPSGAILDMKRLRFIDPESGHLRRSGVQLLKRLAFEAED